MQTPDGIRQNAPIGSERQLEPTRGGQNGNAVFRLEVSLNKFLYGLGCTVQGTRVRRSHIIDDQADVARPNRIGIDKGRLYFDRLGFLTHWFNGADIPVELPRKGLDGLGLAVFEDGEIISREVRDRIALSVGHNGVDDHHIHGYPKGKLFFHFGRLNLVVSQLLGLGRHPRPESHAHEENERRESFP